MCRTFKIAIVCLVTGFASGQQTYSINEKFDNSAYFELNETENFDNLTLDFLRNLIAKYPDICIEFKQGVSPLERKKIANRRMKQFKRTLVSNSIDLRNFRFDKKFFYLTDSYSVDQRSRIEGRVVSITQVCE